MKILRGTIEELQAIDSKIVTGMVAKYHSHMTQWTDIEHDSEGHYIILNENDKANPLQFLTDAEKKRLQDYEPPVHEVHE